jgi:hypothetical protein
MLHIACARALCEDAQLGNPRENKEGKKMRRVTMLLAAMAVIVTLFAAAAYAVTI